MVKIKENTAIQTHINILQNIISRMANNSANCKTWAITIISAIAVLLIDQSKTNIYFIAYIPLIMFFFLDCFYLGLERYFRGEFGSFVNHLSNARFNFNMVYIVKGRKDIFDAFIGTLWGAWSFSTTPFYLILGFLMFIMSKVS